MPDEPFDDPRIWEMIEACRSGGGDLEDPALAPLVEQLAAHPELAEVLKRLQGLDASLAAAFQDVPLPEGLKQRINTRLASVRNGQKSGAAAPSVAEPEVPPEEVRKPVAAGLRRPAARRWLAAGGAVVAVAASVALAAVFLGGPPVLDRHEVLEAAKSAFDDDRGTEGTLLAESPAPRGYPIGQDIVFSRVREDEIRWRRVSGFLGCTGVAYDLGPARNHRATLYVVRGTVPDLGTAPPHKPDSETGGQCVGAWQSGELVYVLVVQGGRGAYRSLLRPPGTVA